MSTPKPYWEKLKDPRWQKKRLEVLECYKFTCADCGSTDKTLHVHHMIYRKGAEPWEYEPMGDLMALCEDCHTERTLVDNAIKEALTDGVYRDIARLLLQAGSCNRSHAYGGMLNPFYHALWSYLERFHGVPWRLSGDLTESRMDSLVKCLGWLKDATAALCEAANNAVASYEEALLKFQSESKK